MNKRKILTLAVSICMIAILAIGGTLAYYMDTDELLNTFTAGKVDILLDEAIVDKDANQDYVQSEDEDGNTRTNEEQKYDLHPGQTVLKDPTIWVAANPDPATGEPLSLPAYIAAKIIVTGDAGLAALTNGRTDGYPVLHINALASGGLADEPGTYVVDDWNGLSDGVHETDSAFVYQDWSKAAEGKWIVYMFIKAPVEPGEKVVLFEQLNISKDYQNEQMAILNGMNIKVEAYAVQTESFSDNGADGSAVDGQGCYDAITAAFPNIFANE